MGQKGEHGKAERKDIGLSGKGRIQIRAKANESNVNMIKEKKEVKKV